MNEVVSVVSQFSMQQFHFLRPWWLLSIVPALWLVWFFWRQKSSAVNWRGAINENLIEHLIETDSTRLSRWPWVILFTTWVLTAIAISGPTWEKLPQPVLQKQDALVIILDLSLSMRSEDIKPSRLIRARHKILDVLKHRNEGLTALIAYSGDAHIVSPLTDDNATVANLLPALAPEMMPVYGSDPVSALNLAQQLFKNSGFNEGRILLVTDSISDNDLNDIDNSIHRNGFDLSILGVGTKQGAPIPTKSGFIKDSNGTIVLPQLPRKRLNTLAKTNDGRYTDVSLNDNDIEFLLPSTSPALNKNTIVSEREFDQWNDRGYLILILLLPISLLAFRRGWLLVLPLFILIEPQNSYAFEWKDLWQRSDQQAAEKLSNGDAKAAAELFKDKQWQAAAQYKAEDYEAATENFDQFDNADAHYNRANALAKTGKLDDAIKAYDEALKRQPDMEDALFNKELVEKLKNQQNSSDKSNSDDSESQQSDKDDKQEQQGDSSKQNNKDQQGDQQKENQDQQQGDSSQQKQDQQQKSDNQQSSNKEDKKSPQDPNDGADLPDENSSKEDKEKQSANQQDSEKSPPEDKRPEQASAKEQDKQAQQDEKEKQQAQQRQVAQDQVDKENQQKQQATEQWLRQIPDEPSGLLRRKFDYEHRLRQRNQNSTKNQREQPKW